MEMDDPARMKLRSDNELPVVVKSKTLMDEPNRRRENIDNEDPRRQYDRRDIELPKLIASKIERVDPNRVIP
jgi:hypothetical protein